ncbi:uncharacterized protein SCHCODRAFT_02671943 [Schizophyllum commune H4-8]|uniref:BRCT domain-containing protein n=1 Tax=Schizophyllum commune (strain H4-8 / FGSC 9210) TaxID=578458 RepID=D8QGE8_SCHCM|nr:uncharacterized protein SCHCODRAFT_02671943 [Schizophyllum commune H4-8]KAI5888032.1 hypothetical protein SCHCODRAFT_02671943 [Schizophyllum commune H4-8]
MALWAARLVIDALLEPEGVATLGDMKALLANVQNNASKLEPDHHLDLGATSLSILMDVDSYYLEQDERMGMESEEQDEIMESLSAFASAPKTDPDTSVNDSIHEFDATKSPKTLAKALPKTKELTEERENLHKKAKRKIDAHADSAPPTAVQESSVSDDITSFSIVEERPRKRLRTLAMIGVKPKKTAPKKLAKLHIPTSPRKQPPSSDVATSPIEESSALIGHASAGPSSAAAKPKRGSLLTALEERIASAKSSGSLAPQATMKRPADEPAEASGSKTKKTKESKRPKETKKDKESSRRHDSSRSKHTKSEQQQQQPPPQPKPAPPPIPTTYAECVRQKKKEIRSDMKQNIFTGMDVFLVIDDEDMEDVEAKVLCLVRCGARLMERYIPDKCTHIICASDKTLHPSLFYKLQVTSVDEVPEHIPILNWKFVLKCITKYNKEEGPIIKARQEKADLEWRGLKRKNPAPALVPLEDRPQGFFFPPQEEWPKYSACPWRGEGAAQAVGGEPRQRALSYASSEASESSFSSPSGATPGAASRATSEAASGADDAPEGKAGNQEVDPLVPFYEQAKDDRAKEYEEEHGFPPPGDLWDLEPDEDEDLDVPVVGEKGDQYDRTEETEDENDVEDSPVKKGKKAKKGEGKQDP